MGCNCGGGNKGGKDAGRSVSRIPVNVPKPRVVPVIPPSPPTRPRAIQGITQVNRKSCHACGWLLARTRYVDVTTKKLVEKHACPNRKCLNYNR